jgi:hypothetical protein
MLPVRAWLLLATSRSLMPVNAWLLLVRSSLLLQVRAWQRLPVELLSVYPAE